MMITIIITIIWKMKWKHILMNRLNLIRNHLKQSEQPTQPSIIVESYQNNSKIKFVRLNNLKNLNALSNEFGNEILNALGKLDQDDGTKVIFLKKYNK